MRIEFMGGMIDGASINADALDMPEVAIVSDHHTPTGEHVIHVYSIVGDKALYMGLEVRDAFASIRD